MTKPFDFRQTDTGLLRRLFDVQNGLREPRWLPENLHVFDGIETIPSSVNIWMRCHLSPVMRWPRGLVLRSELFLDWGKKLPLLASRTRLPSSRGLSHLMVRATP